STELPYQIRKDREDRAAEAEGESHEALRMYEYFELDPSGSAELISVSSDIEFPTLILISDRSIIPIPFIAGPVKETKWYRDYASNPSYYVEHEIRSFLNYYRERGRYDQSG